MCCMSWTLLLFSNTGFPVFIGHSSSLMASKFPTGPVQVQSCLQTLEEPNFQLRLTRVQSGTYPQVKVFTVYLL